MIGGAILIVIVLMALLAPLVSPLRPLRPAAGAQADPADLAREREGHLGASARHRPPRPRLSHPPALRRADLAADRRLGDADLRRDRHHAGRAGRLFRRPRRHGGRPSSSPRGCRCRWCWWRWPWSSLVGVSLTVVIWVLGLLIWDRFAVVMRSATQQVRSREFITAAQAVGCSTPRILLTEMPPNVCQSPDRGGHAGDGAAPSCWRRRCRSWGWACSRRRRPGA